MPLPPPLGTAGSVGLCQEMHLHIQSYVLTRLRSNSWGSREELLCWDVRVRLFVKTNVRGEIRTRVLDDVKCGGVAY